MTRKHITHALFWTAWLMVLAPAAASAGAAPPPGESVEIELKVQRSDAVDGVWGSGDQIATMRIGVSYGGTGVVFASLGSFEREDSRGVGVQGVSATTPAETERSRRDRLQRAPRVWQVLVRPLPATIGEVRLELEWEYWAARAPGHGVRIDGGVRQLAIREGRAHVLDARRDAEAPGARGQEGGLTILELSARVLADPRFATQRMQIELWHQHTDAAGQRQVRRTRVPAEQGEEVEAGFEPLRFAVPAGGGPEHDVVLDVRNRLQARLRDDGSIEVLIGTTRRIGLTPRGEPRLAWGGFGAGSKVLSLRPGEAIGIALPSPGGVGRQALAEGGSSAFESGATRDAVATIEGDDLVVDYARFFAGHADQITLVVRLGPDVPGA